MSAYLQCSLSHVHHCVDFKRSWAFSRTFSHYLSPLKHHWSLDEVYLIVSAQVRLSRVWAELNHTDYPQHWPVPSKEKGKERVWRMSVGKEPWKGWKHLHWAGIGQLSEEDSHESYCSYSPLIMNILYLLDWFPPTIHKMSYSENGAIGSKRLVSGLPAGWVNAPGGWAAERLALHFANVKASS